MTTSAADVGDPPAAREIVRGGYRADVDARLRRHRSPKNLSFTRPILSVMVRMDPKIAAAIAAIG